MAQQQPAQPCGLATASLILGICSFVFLFVGSIAAIITGHIARGRIRNSNATLTGDGLAQAGLIMGYASMVLGMGMVLIVSISFMAGTLAISKAKKLTSEATAKALETAITNFQVEYNCLPNVGDKVKTDTGDGVRLLNILLGLETETTKLQNVRMLKLLEAKETKTKSNGLLYRPDGRSVEGLYDAWGNPFTVELDTKYEERLRITLGSKTTVLNGRSVAVYSPGADKKFGTADDVTSW
jgi:hypothetical protein